MKRDLANQMRKQYDMMQAELKESKTTDTLSLIKNQMQLSITDLCPFFCLRSDLEGKNFKQVRKREMMSPFTLYYNMHEILEIVREQQFVRVPTAKKGAPLNQYEKQFLAPNYYFQTYRKVDCNVEKTLLKISFKDLDVMKAIVDHLNNMLKEEYQRIEGSKEIKEDNGEVSQSSFGTDEEELHPSQASKVPSGDMGVVKETNEEVISSSDNENEYFKKEESELSYLDTSYEEAQKEV